MDIVLGVLMEVFDKTFRQNPFLRATLLWFVFLIGCGFAYLEWMAG